jgi:hypothetical protein
MKNSWWFIITLMALTGMSSCSSYYMAINAPVKNISEKAATVQQLKNENRVFILRNGAEAFLMTDLFINEKENTVQCLLDTVPVEHRLHLTNGRKGKMKYYKGGSEPGDNGDKDVLNEAHLYIDSDSSISTGMYTTSLTNIRQIEVIEKDNQRTTSNNAVAAIITTVSLGAIMLVILASSISFDFSVR